MDSPIIGQIDLFPYQYIPSGWMKCDGSQLSIQTNQVLYSLIGISYGGNGTSNFNLPNLNDASPVPNTVYCIAVEGIYPQRD